MERKIFIILACIFFIVGCASVQNQSHFTENTFFCDYPKLEVKILKDVLKQTEKSKQGKGWTMFTHWFKISSAEYVGVRIWRFGYNSNAEWQSSDEQILINIGMVPLDQADINDKTWVKFAYLRHENWVDFGYFRRIDNNLVAVFCEINNKKYKDEIESLKKTRVLTEKHKQLINQAFEYLEKAFVIG